MKAGLRLTKIADVLARRGVGVPYRTSNRFATERCGFAQRGRVTVRVADGEPGAELQVDFGRMGVVFDPASRHRRVVWALIFTACYSRHCFVWLSHRQDLEDVIAGFEADWAFFEGVFRVVVPESIKAIVEEADDLHPCLNQAFVEYAQARGFVIDPARVRHPKDKPWMERAVPYVRGSFFAGEDFADLADAQRRGLVPPDGGSAGAWHDPAAAGRRVRNRRAAPAEASTLDAYDLPVYACPKVARDDNVEVAKALYSVPGHLIRHRIDARTNGQLVKLC